MPLDRHASRFLEMLAAAGETRGRYEHADERRHALSNLAVLVDPPGDTGIEDVHDRTLAVEGGVLALRVYSPLGATGKMTPGMVFFHGGGWVAGSLETHDGLCRRLAQESGCRVVAVGYRLAPEHPFPQALEDGCAAFCHVATVSQDFGVDPARLGIAGDSAGGTLAAAICHMSRNERLGAGKFPDIAFQLLICPILDVHGESEARRQLADGYFLDRDTLLRDLELYCPGQDRSDPRLSPLLAKDFSGLPPAIIHTGQFDPFRDEGEAYAAKLSGAGVPVRNLCHPGMIHYFYCMPRMIPYAREAARMIGADIRETVKLRASAGAVKSASGLP